MLFSTVSLWAILTPFGLGTKWTTAVLRYVSKIHNNRFVYVQTDCKVG